MRSGGGDVGVTQAAENVQMGVEEDLMGREETETGSG